MIAKPPYGAPCNGCGACCRSEICPPGAAVLGHSSGPCPALVDAGSAGAECGIVRSPQHYAPVKTLINGEAAMRAAFLLLIAAGAGCDAEEAGEIVSAGARRAFHAKARQIPFARVQRAFDLWGI